MSKNLRWRCSSCGKEVERWIVALSPFWCLVHPMKRHDWVSDRALARGIAMALFGWIS